MIRPVFNKTSLRTAGDNTVLRNSGGICHRTYTEGYFMQKSPLAKDYVKSVKTNPIIRGVKRLYAMIKGIFSNSEPHSPTPFEDIKDIKCTTIEI